MSVTAFFALSIGLAFLIWFLLWIRYAGRCRIVGKSDEVFSFLKRSRKALWYFPHYRIGLFPLLNSSLGITLNREKYRPKREVLHGVDGGEFCLDWFTLLGNASDAGDILPDDAPILVIEHGMGGGSGERYVQKIGLRVRRELGWRSVCILFRGCCGTRLTTPRIYHAGQTEDYHVALQTIHARYPHAPILLIGYSMGSNVMIRYLGEQFSSTQPRVLSRQYINKEGICPNIVAAVAVGCPFNFPTLFAHYPPLVLEHVGRNLFKYMEKHRYMFDSDPRFRAAMDGLRESGDMRITTVDDAFAPFMDPAYADGSDCHKESSCDQYLDGVSVPLLCIAAKNDPLSTYNAFPEHQILSNPHVGAIVSPGGAHLGFFHFLSTQHTLDEEIALAFFRHKLGEWKADHLLLLNEKSA